MLKTELTDAERERLLVELRDHGHVLSIVTQRTREGDPVEVESSVLAVEDGARGRVGYVCVSRDVSHRRRLERRLEETRHLELVAQLAGGIAHDLNTLLTAMLGYADLTAADPALPGHLVADVEQISIAARRAGTLTGQLLAFSRKQMLEPRDVDLDEVIAASRPARQRIAGRRVELVDRPAASLTLVHVDPRQLERVLLDLVTNAADAMPEGGTLTTVTSHEDGFARLEITDTGAGMDEETRMRAFQPFYTTKPGHTGLGLSSAHGIVVQSGGELALEPAAEGGTTVILKLPYTHA